MSAQFVVAYWIFFAVLVAANKFYGQMISATFQSTAFIILLTAGAVMLLVTILSLVRSKRGVMKELTDIEQTMRKEIDRERSH